MEWSPTRREFLGAAGAGSLAPASADTVSWGNVTGAVPDNPFAPEADVRWTVDLGGGSVGPFELVDDTLYVRADSSVRALSTDGSERWRFETASNRLSLLVGPDSGRPDGTVYVNDDGVYALDSREGRTRWRYDTENYPIIWGATSELAFVRDDGIAALSSTDGSVRWRFDPGGQLWLRPHTHEETLYVGTTEAELYALATVDGSVRWRVDRSTGDGIETETPNLFVIDVADGHAFAWNSDDGVLSAFDAADGTERWRFEASDASSIFPGAVGDGTVYVNDGGAVQALAIEDGHERWRVDAGMGSRWRPQPLGGDVYAASEDGLLALNSEGRERWRSDAGLLAPLEITDDELVAADPDGTIYGIGVGDGDVRWRFDLPGDLVWIPLASDDGIYVGTDAGTLYAVSAPESTLAYDAYRTATTPASLAVSGLLGGALAVGAYRRRNRDEPAADPPEPETFDDFELVELIAETEVAEVHEARTPGGERVALKRLTTDGLSDDRFAEAIRAWADLDHEGVLDIREWDTDPEQWVVTEYADATLADRATDLTTGEIAHAVADVAETLHRAHRDGVVHGRLTPENVLFADESVRVDDWRLAAELRDSPDEQATRADDTSRLAEMARDLLADEREVAELSDVLSRALADDPDDRYDSALKFADALRWAARSA